MRPGDWPVWNASDGSADPDSTIHEIGGMYLKKCIVWLLFLPLLVGCSGASKDLDTGMALRSKILQSPQCLLTLDISADYNGRTSRFTMDCTADRTGDLSFNVVAPETISGISGKLTGEEGQICFDNMTLQFPLAAEDLPSPISAPWILINSLRCGFLSSACVEEGEIRLSIDNRFSGDILRLDVWLNEENLPVHADILADGCRILSLDVMKFEIS